MYRSSLVGAPGEEEDSTPPLLIFAPSPSSSSLSRHKIHPVPSERETAATHFSNCKKKMEEIMHTFQIVWIGLANPAPAATDERSQRLRQKRGGGTKKKREGRNTMCM